MQKTEITIQLCAFVGSCGQDKIVSPSNTQHKC
jgi:hypothetical protein